MERLTRFIGLLLIALFSIAAQPGLFAQFSKTIDIAQKYGITPATGNKTVGESMSLAQARVTFDDVFRRAVECTDKLTDQQILNMTMFEAAHTDALWEGVSLIVQPDFRLHGGLLLSRNRIIWPLGGYRITMPLEYAYNNIEGQGNGVGNLEYGGGYGATEIEPWLERWQDNPRHIVVLRSFHHGSDNFFGYGEGVIIKNFRVNGKAGRWHDPNRAITGVQLWDLGEASDFTDVMVYHCDTGINMVRGTPFTSSGCISVFSNNCAGLAITGGSTASIQTLSGDDNARFVHVRGGYGRPATAGLHIGAVKSEWAIADPNQRTWKPNVWELDGWVRLHIGFFSHATGNAYQDALFIVKPDVNTSHIAVDDFRLFAGANMQVLLRDRVNREAWLFDNGWGSGIQEFRWTSTGGGNLESWPTQATRIEYPFTGGQLGYLRGDPTTGQPVGSFNRTAGTPTWSDVTGSSTAPVTPPSPCTYTYSAWSTCVNGTQTRTVTSSTPAGCTGTPVLTQTCTTSTPTPSPCTYTYSAWSTCVNGTQTRTVVSSTPTGCTGTPVLTQTCTTSTTPPTTGALLTRDNVNVTSDTYSEDINNITVRRIVITGFSRTGTGYSCFAVPDGAVGLNYIGMYPDGNWYFNMQRCNVTTTNGVTTITLPTAVTVSRLGTWIGQGGSMIYRATRVEFFAQ